MYKRLFIILLAPIHLLSACRRGGEQRTVVDTLHTSEVAMSVYYHHPDRALQIIDSALLVGNID
ncbi:MAG: hypothetical protein SPL12_05325 [Bacteroidales bacterium]|nr:hypothetical protein [Bacteroidales bacterium]